MTPDLRDYARLLLGREPTRSLPLGILRERLRHAAGTHWSGPGQLEQMLGADPGFRVLRLPPLVEAPPGGYAPEVLAIGFPSPEPRVLLIEAECPAGEPDVFGTTRDSLVALLAREGMRTDVAEAIAALEEIGARIREAVTPAAAGYSTNPPPDPLPPAPTAPGARPRARRRTRSPGCR